MGFKMIVKCYAIYDAKISQYRLAIFDIEDGGGMRQFSDAVNDSTPNNPWNKHPEDYSLWFVGEFDTNNGKLKDSVPINLVNATAVLSLKENKIENPQIV